MNAPGKRKSRKPVQAQASRLPALVAIGGVATAFSTPALALEIGEANVSSTLGQPLKASVAYALNPNEQLYDFCVFLNKGVATDGVPTLTKAKVTIVGNQIHLTGTVPIKEPLLSMRLTVDCPYTAHLSREYTLMINPPGTVEAVAPVATAAAAPVVTRNSEAAREPAPRRAAATTVADSSPISAGSEYRVQAGDSASQIATRISNRPVGLWPAVNAIFDANPHAFVGGDVNQLIAGTVITIPSFDGSVASERPKPEVLDLETPVTVGTGESYDGYQAPAETQEPVKEQAQEPAQASIVPAVEPTAVAPATAEPAAVETTPAITDDTAVLSAGEADVATTDKVATANPGDVFVGSDIPADASVQSANDPALPLTDAAPSIVATSNTSSNNTLLLWLGGAGIALIAGLLLFGRRIRDLFGGGAENRLPPLHGNEDEQDLEVTQKNVAVPDVEFNMDTDAITGQHKVELDADLGMGTGLQDSDDIDVAQDFGFAGTIVQEEPLDLEIPEHAALVAESSPTDILPPQHRQEAETILDSEEPPADEDTTEVETFAEDDNATSEYDMSMIVDATKQAIHEAEGTTKDLMAVQMAAEPADQPAESEYTLSREVDYKILEQDYEDELSATQALNEEIAKAALELAERMEVDDPDITSAQESLDDVTANLPSATDPENTAELTANLPTDATAENDAFISDLDDTGVNEELTVEMSLDDDATVEMDVESGSIDTKKIAG